MWILIKVWLLCQLCCFIIVDAASPVFTKPPSGTGSAQAIEENKVVGSTIISLDAIDVDGDLLKFTVVSQSPPSPVFQINSNDELVVPSGLDYETTKLFSFKLRVSDGTNSDVTSYNITILDVDDESPVFSKAKYSTAIFETAETGKTLTTVTATDKDSASIEYSFEGSQTAFAVNKSGTIYVASKTDLANIMTGGNIQLTVNANDGINPVGKALVDITIKEDPCKDKCKNVGTCEVIDTIPTCHCHSGYIGNECESVDYCYMNPCKNSGSCSSKESSYTCSCTLCFTGQNCSTSYDPCSNGNCVDNACVCEDGYKGTYCNVRKSSPVFTKPPSGTGSAQTIAENKVVGSIIISLKATDADGDPLTFTVVSQSPPSPVFQINSNDELVVPSGLDYETTNLFSFKFSVSDGSNSDETTYNLTVLNVDDESPVFTKTNISVTIYETAKKGYIVTTVTATDKDSSSIQYSLGGSKTTFAIDHNGVIIINDPADLANYKGNELTLQVTASDGTNPVGRTSVLITVLESPCSGEKCKNGGTCQVTSTSYKCNCFDGYVGDHCESVDFCFTHPCMKNGRCHSRETDYTCDCDKHWTGQNCTTYITPTDEVVVVGVVVAAIVVAAIVVVALVYCIGSFLVYFHGVFCVCCTVCKNTRHKGPGDTCTCSTDSVTLRMSVHKTLFIGRGLYYLIVKRRITVTVESYSKVCLLCAHCAYCKKNPYIVTEGDGSQPAKTPLLDKESTEMNTLEDHSQKKTTEREQQSVIEMKPLVDHSQKKTTEREQQSVNEMKPLVDHTVNRKQSIEANENDD